jgi:hypothetical protein
MKKADLLAVVAAKPGYVEIIEDKLAPDSVGAEEKRYLIVKTLNADGTKGVTNVFYIHNPQTGDAWFYNVEPVAFDNKYQDVPAQTLAALRAYCKANFAAYFLIPDRIDAENKWAVVEAYVTSGSPVKLTKSLKMVYKQGNDPIKHTDII